MSKMLILLSMLTLTAMNLGCRKCYDCLAQTEFGQLHREVCGQKSQIKALINHLETYADSTGVGPWDCE